MTPKKEMVSTNVHCVDEFSTRSRDPYFFVIILVVVVDIVDKLVVVVSVFEVVGSIASQPRELRFPWI